MSQKQNIHLLLHKFIKNECNEKEIETVIAYFKKVKGTEDLPNLEEVMLLLEGIPKKDIKVVRTTSSEILREAKRRETTLPFKKLWKYAAAASVLLIAALTIFLNKGDDTPQFTTPIIVNNQIETGTNGAILTLESGEEVTLEKGTPYQTQNASSNGEEIIYKDTASEKIVYNTLTIPRGKQFYILLSDGTKVWLNSESQIKYPITFIEGQTRQVDLVYGEAYFHVSPSTDNKGSKFKVYHNAQEVEVLGTQFNIKAYKDETNIYTTLVEGKVAVEYLGKSKILAPTEQTSLNIQRNSLTVAKVDVARVISWKDGVFSFKGMSLKEIMNVLSRWYDMEVVFENKTLKEVKFRGVFDKSISIEEILSSIKSTNFINNYEIKGKTIILK